MALRNLSIFFGIATWWLTVSAVKPPLHLDADTSAKGSELPFHTACERDCSPSPRAYYCASNGRTYDSHCRVLQAVCNDPYLNVTAGKCKNSARCRKERSHILKVQSLRNYTKPENVPSCNGDGSYAPTQCSVFLGYCWCVTSLGELKNSTFKIGTTTHSCDGPTRSRGRRKCNSVADRAAFAIKLRELILRDDRRRSSSATEEERQRDAVNRKHDATDRDDDGSLSQKEMKKLLKRYRRKMPRKMRSCAKIFWKYCDFDGNRVVSAAEWGLCLGVQQNLKNTPHKRDTPATQNIIATRGADPTKRHQTRDVDSDSRTPDQPVGTSPSSSRRTCREERIELLKGHKKNVNIPECTGLNDEFYTQIQCHGRFCYCVVRDTGAPVASTSRVRAEGMPNCERAESPDVPHPIEGCPSRLKTKFLRDVRKLLITEMISSGHRNAGDLTSSVKERAARWYFAVVDRNGDDFLGRKENKAFKKLLSSDKNLSKKCLKRFTQHCDRSKDGKTTLDEFIGCLEVRRQEHPNLPPYPDLRGSINQLKTTEDPDNL